MEQELNEETLQDLYAWIDKIPLSRPKRHITRDFADGVMAAELVKHFFPKLVELHNYSPASSTQQKLSNWNILNRKVLAKLNFHVTEDTVKKIVLSSPGAIEPVLCNLRDKIDKKLDNTGGNDLEYYSTRNEGKHPTELRRVEARIQPQLKGGGEREKDQTITEKSSAATQITLEMDPAVRLILQEKEQALMAFQETVEVQYSMDSLTALCKILQMKVNRLEHLVQLKDMRIEDLTRHLETYKTRAKLP